ncbi:MAG TPA: ArsR family transcriptional regulator [Anaerolineae bacterium]|nr:ArsR family transcriptional regulator [Anaerolineae bacterium]
MSLARLSSFLKTLCEENRMSILCFLMQGERNVCNLAACLDLPQNLVSHHLGILREMGLVVICPCAGRTALRDGGKGRGLSHHPR